MLFRSVLDTIMSNPRTKQLQSWERPDPSLKEIRARFAPDISDEELLIRFMMSDEEVDAMIAKGPLRVDRRRSSNNIVESLVDLIDAPAASTSFAVSTPKFSVRAARTTT